MHMHTHYNITLFLRRQQQLLLATLLKEYSKKNSYRDEVANYLFIVDYNRGHLIRIIQI